MLDVADDTAQPSHRARERDYHDEDRSTDMDSRLIAPLRGSDEQPQMTDDVLKPEFDNEGPILKPMTMIPVVGEYHCDIEDPQEHVRLVGQEGSSKRVGSVLRKHMEPLGPDRFRLQRSLEPSVAHFLRNVSFLRANQEDLEMMSLDQKPAARSWERDVGVVCQ